MEGTSMRATMARVSTSSQSSLPTTELASYSAAMANHAEPYRGLPGFALDDAPAAPSPLERALPNPIQSLRENVELITDLARYTEGVLTEKQVRKKHHLLTEATWTALNDDAVVEAVELEQTRRIRSGAAKRELAQLHVVKGPSILNSIATSPRANDKHKIDAVKALDALADPGPEAAVEQERVHIVINLTGDSKLKDPKDILVIDAAARPSTPKQITDESDEWRR